ncbi:MAG: hypothetical protein ACOC80_06440 [Petrotogales bacterium]
MKKEMIIVGIVILLICVGLSGCVENDVSGKSMGVLYINDCGEPRGGFEYAASYYANLTLTNGTGILTFEVENGLGDHLEKHEYSVVLQEYTKQEMKLWIDGRLTTLEWVENDTVWNMWHNHYIASYGINMPRNKRIGKIRPRTFPGLYSHYYVEIRLPEIG